MVGSEKFANGKVWELKELLYFPQKCPSKFLFWLTQVNNIFKHISRNKGDIYMIYDDNFFLKKVHQKVCYFAY